MHWRVSSARRLRLPHLLGRLQTMSCTPLEVSMPGLQDKIVESKLAGHSDREIVKTLKISFEGYYAVIRRNPDITERIQNARSLRLQQAAFTAEQAIDKLTTGFKVPMKRTKTITKNTPQGIITETHVEEYEEYVKPASAAIIFTLLNRLPDDWKQRLHVTPEMPMQPHDLEKLKAEISAMVKENGFHDITHQSL